MRVFSSMLSALSCAIRHGTMRFDAEADRRMFVCDLISDFLHCQGRVIRIRDLVIFSTMNTIAVLIVLILLKGHILGSQYAANFLWSRYAEDVIKFVPLAPLLLRTILSRVT